MDDININNLLATLKSTGYTQVECVKFLKENLHMSLKEADNAVLNSLVWRDELYKNQIVRDDFFDFLDNLPDTPGFNNKK